MIIGAIVVLVLIVGGGYYVFNQSQQATLEDQATDTTSDTSNLSTISPNDSTSTGAISAEEGEVKEFTVEGTSNLKFTPATISVNQGDTVRITFKNISGKHDFKIDEFNVGTKVIEVGEEETIEFVADKAGNFEFYCSVPGHRVAGMKGTLVVQ